MKKKQPLPYFPFWAYDWLDSAKVRLMSSAQKGIFTDLLCVDWKNDGLPENDREARVYCAFDTTDADFAAVVALFSEKHPETGRRTHFKLNAERVNYAEYCKKQAERGKKGGRPPQNPDESQQKPGDNPEETRRLPGDNQTVLSGKPGANPGETREKPPTPTPTPNDNVLLEKEPKGDGVAAPAVGSDRIAPFVSPSLGDPFPADDAENPGSGEAGATESPAGNPGRITTNDAAFADFLAKGPKIERPAPEPEATKPKKAKAAKQDKPSPAMPFPSEAFANAWAGFVEMRERNRWKLTDRAIELIFGDLTVWGEAKAIRALQNSTVKSWRGVFEPDAPRGNAEIKRQDNGKVSTGIDYSQK